MKTSKKDVPRSEKLKKSPPLQAPWRSAATMADATPAHRERELSDLVLAAMHERGVSSSKTRSALELKADVSIGQREKLKKTWVRILFGSKYLTIITGSKKRLKVELAMIQKIYVENLISELVQARANAAKEAQTAANSIARTAQRPTPVPSAAQLEADHTKEELKNLLKGALELVSGNAKTMAKRLHNFYLTGKTVKKQRKVKVKPTHATVLRITLDLLVQGTAEINMVKQLTATTGTKRFARVDRASWEHDQAPQGTYHRIVLEVKSNYHAAATWPKIVEGIRAVQLLSFGTGAGRFKVDVTEDVPPAGDGPDHDTAEWNRRKNAMKISFKGMGLLKAQAQAQGEDGNDGGNTSLLRKSKCSAVGTTTTTFAMCSSRARVSTTTGMAAERPRAVASTAGRKFSERRLT